MFFVHLSGDVTERPEGVTVLGAHELTGMVIDAGMSGWLRAKVAERPRAMGRGRHQAGRIGALFRAAPMKQVV